jgi:hypothetical protein
MNVTVDSDDKHALYSFSSERYENKTPLYLPNPYLSYLSPEREYNTCL